MVRYQPLGVVGVIGPWNYPLTNSFGDCIPALAAGNAVVLKPSEVTPLTSLLMAEMLARVRDARGRLPGRHRRRRDRRRAHRPRRLHHVHRLHAHGPQGRRARRADAHARGARAGRQGPDDRPRRRRPRARRQRRRLLLDAERGPDLHLGRARLRRGARLRRVRRQGRREGPQRCARAPRPAPAPPRSGRSPSRPRSTSSTSTSSDAVEKGARVVAGGHRREGPGRFYEPTVLADVDHSMTAMTEETFGPTLPIMKVRDAEEADPAGQRLAPTGSPASVWTQGRRARRGARAAGRGRRRVRQRRDAQLRGARAADGRLEELGPGRAPRRRRHPQVLRAAGAARQALRAQARRPHVPLQGADHPPGRPRC